MGKIIELMKQPSSWAGIGILLNLFAPHYFTSDKVEHFITGMTGLCATLAILISEKK